MLRLTLAQMRRSLGRLVAGGVAIALGSAFVTVTLLAGDVMTRTTHRAVTASYADADIVVQGWSMTDQDAAALREVPGVDAVEPHLSTDVQVDGPDGMLRLEVEAPAADPRLEPQTVLDGVLPGPGELALPSGSAGSLGLDLGDQATITLTGPSADGMDLESRTTSLTVVGLLDDGASGLLGGPPTALAARTQILDWVAFQMPDEQPAYSLALVATADGADLAEVKAAIRASLAATSPVADQITVLTMTEQAERIVAGLTSDARMLTTIGLGFAAIALLVAALVIANTFQVLVAQRTRTLALLRCVGADRSQLRRSVIIEALVLGLLAATTGLLLGIGLVQVALLVFGRTMPNVPLPATATVTVAAVLAPLAVGIGVTVVAALAPARAATRVSPLAAMRPSDAPTVSDRGGRARAWISGALVLAGALAMTGGAVAANQTDVMRGLGLGILGGAVSFLGVLLSAVFWVPRLVGLVARAVGRDPATRLAGANSTRNPRRTAATSTALLIGVTLVVMMATGAATARAALDERLDQEYPVDVTVSAFDDQGEPGQVPDGLASAVAGTDGVATVVSVSGAIVDIAGLPDGGLWAASVQAVGIDVESGRAVVRSDDEIAGLGDGTVIVPRDLADRTGIEDGDTISISGSSEPGLSADEKPASGTAVPVDLTVAVTDLPGTTLVLTTETLAATADAQEDSQLWIRLDDRADQAQVLARIETAASRSESSAVMVTGAAAARAAYQQVIDTLLAIVVGLLGVSVVIALVGVANTLSLSVIERRRESATLRAIGLSRRQLRGSLAAEGMIIAGVGALAGTVLGTVYGWAGAHIVLNAVGRTPFVVAWREVTLVLVVAVVAGLVASVLPARGAVRTSPVEALTVE